jgi:hypothetical protein
MSRLLLSLAMEELCNASVVDFTDLSRLSKMMVAVPFVGGNESKLG